MDQQLARTLGVFRGTSVLLTIVIGAGLLTLPGLAVRVAGDHALLAWATCAVVALPLLSIFIVLGCRYPEAGGIATYADRAFGRIGRDGAGFLFLGAVLFGLPAIALTGGHYLAAATGLSAHLLALILLIAALGPHLVPGEGTARAMSMIASTIIAAMLTFLVIGFVGTDPSPAAAGLHALPANFDLALMLAPMMMIFFAFTGWEVGAGIVEEFRNPKRDYPVAMLLSFAIAAGFYFAIAYLAQTRDLGGLHEAPFVAILQPVLGAGGVMAVAATAGLIVFANLAGAIWGVSRMVFGLARDGTLPASLARTTNGRPLAAVITTLAALTCVLVADWLGAFGLEQMLSLAGQNFVVLFGVAAAALAGMARALRERLLGLVVTLVVVAILVPQGLALAYPIALFGIALATGSARWLRRRLEPA
jgi:amino acid efflux transporter